MTKYKYSRKQILEKLGFTKYKGVIGFPNSVKGIDLVDLLATVPEPNETPDEAYWESVKPLKKIMRLELSLQQKAGINFWNIESKLNEVIDRLNTLTEDSK